jgi:hypothetical protein
MLKRLKSDHFVARNYRAGIRRLVQEFGSLPFESCGRLAHINVLAGGLRLWLELQRRSASSTCSF